MRCDEILRLVSFDFGPLTASLSLSLSLVLSSRSLELPGLNFWRPLIGVPGFFFFF